MNDDELAADLARLRARSCTGKRCFTPKGARLHAAMIRTENGSAREAYRCHFADEHDDPRRAWHTGRPLTMGTIRWIAALLRARAGHAPSVPGTGRPDR